MKKHFFIGFLVGICFSTFVFLAISYNRMDQLVLGKQQSVVVQKQVEQNIQDSICLLKFADSSLSEYLNSLFKIRSILLNAYEKKTNKQNTLDNVIAEMKNMNKILDKAKFNDMLIFYDTNGIPSRVIPVTLAANRPTLQLQISCADFNKKILSKYQEAIVNTLYGTDTSIEELDKIIFSVSIERAKLDSYQKRLDYSMQISSIIAADKKMETKSKSIIKLKQQICDSLYVLCIQSANGIYNDSDRKIIQIRYDELFKELKQIDDSYLLVANTSLLSQSGAEKAMLGFANR